MTLLLLFITPKLLLRYNGEAQPRALARRLERIVGSTFLGAKRTTSCPEVS